MVKMHVMYEGDLHTIATHLPSNTMLHTDAPPEIGGNGQTFSPTDLLAISLASCIATVLGAHAQKHQLDLRGMHVDVEKEMSKDKPRRISKIKIHVKMPIFLDDSQKELIKKVAEACPIHQSLHPEMDHKLTFEWK